MRRVTLDNSTWATVLAGISLIAMFAGSASDVGVHASDFPRSPASATMQATTGGSGMLASLSASTFGPNYAQDLQLLRIENERARRLLGVIPELERAASTEYLARLRAIFDAVPQDALQLPQCGAMAQAYVEARIALEESLPSARQWALVARALEPDLADRPVRLPGRFIRRPPAEETGELTVSARDLRVTRAVLSTLEPGHADSDSA